MLLTKARPMPGTAQRGHGAQGDAHQRGQTCGDHAQLCGGFHAVSDDVHHHAAPLLEGGAEVKAGHHVLQVGEVLLHQGLVKAVLGLQGGLRRRGDRLLAHEGAAGHRVHDEEGHRDDDPDRQNGKADSFQNIDQSF